MSYEMLSSHIYPPNRCNLLEKEQAFVPTQIPRQKNPNSFFVQLNPWVFPSSWYGNKPPVVRVPVLPVLHWWTVCYLYYLSEIWGFWQKGTCRLFHAAFGFRRTFAEWTFLLSATPTTETDILVAFVRHILSCSSTGTHDSPASAICMLTLKVHTTTYCLSSYLCPSNRYHSQM